MSGHKDMYAYDYFGQGTYINLTNRCTNRCVLHPVDRGRRRRARSRLRHEPDAEEVLEQLWALPPRTVVFCGYSRQPSASACCSRWRARSRRRKRVRLNTNGHGNLIQTQHRARLKGLVDTVSISLNPDAESYDALCRPQVRTAFEAVLDFARACAGRDPGSCLR